MDPILFGKTPSTRNRKLFGYIKSPSSLVAYYPLNETSGQALNQAPLTKGTFNGTLTGVTRGVVGKRGNSYSFNGTSDFVDFSTPNLGMTGNSPFTVFAFVNPSATAGDSPVFSYGPSGASQVISLDYGNVSGQLRSVHFSNNHSFLKTITFNVWQMIALTYDGTTEKLYYNGTSPESWSPTALNLITSQSMTIGKGWNSLIMKASLVQHVALYNQALSAATMLKIAQLSGFA